MTSRFVKGSRTIRMLQMIEAGATLEEIGDEFGISRQRVHQIVGPASRLRDIRSRLDKDIERRIKEDRKIDGKVQRFWSKVRKNQDGCWVWQGYVHPAIGYGIASILGAQYAHRVSFYLAHGYFPQLPSMVLHKCNNGVCVNPSHLYEGTMKENVADAIAARGGIHWNSTR